MNDGRYVPDSLNISNEYNREHVKWSRRVYLFPVSTGTKKEELEGMIGFADSAASRSLWHMFGVRIDTMSHYF